MSRKILFVFALLSTINYQLSTCYASFEDIGVGARAVGMGNAFITVADDVYSIYYNPAGLTALRQKETASSYGRLYFGLDDGSNLGKSFLGYAHPLAKKYGSFGLGWMNFHLSGVYSENTFIFSYAREVEEIKQIPGPLNLGINLKLLNKNYGRDEYTIKDNVFAKSYSKTVLSADLGGLYQLSRYFTVGLLFSDILQPDIGLKDKSVIPLGIKTGISYRSPVLNTALEGSYWGGEIKIYNGLEYWLFAKSFAVRAGWGMGTRSFSNLTFGLSYNIPLLRFDYAFVYPLSGITDILGSHQFSLSFRFGSLLEGPSEDPFYLKKKTKDLEKKFKETEEELSRTKNELEKLKKERVAPPAVTPGITPPGRPPLPGVVPQPPTMRTHKVLEGETLQSIAVKYYGEEKRWVDIYNANKDKIERGVVKPGQILIIP
ncbi:MAG TPA: hypothetical protein DHV62_10895 [Elusimicrobia bacterium]|jgi:hypothetical protein|nr:hypothetical protein [Elusimicrobiota bacterium]